MDHLGTCKKLSNLFTDAIRGLHSQIIKQLSDREFLSKLNRYLIEDNPNAMNFIRTQTSSLNKCSLKNIACCINDQLLQLQHHFKNFQWYQPTLDLSESNF